MMRRMVSSLYFGITGRSREVPASGPVCTVVVPSKMLGRPVVRIVVRGQSVAAHLDAVDHRPRSVAGHVEVAAGQGDAEPVAGGDDDGGRPDLDVQIDGLAGRQRLFARMPVPRAVRQTGLLVQLAVGRAQPAHAEHTVGIDRVHQ